MIRFHHLRHFGSDGAHNHSWIKRAETIREICPHRVEICHDTVGCEMLRAAPDARLNALDDKICVVQPGHNRVRALSPECKIGQRHPPAKANALMIIPTPPQLALDHWRLAELAKIKPSPNLRIQQRQHSLRINRAMQLKIIASRSVVRDVTQSQTALRSARREIWQPPGHVRVAEK